MMATVRHVTSSSGLKKFQTDGFLSDRVYHEDGGIVFLRTVAPNRKHDDITQKTTLESLPYPISCCVL